MPFLTIVFSNPSGAGRRYLVCFAWVGLVGTSFFFLALALFDALLPFALPVALMSFSGAMLAGELATAVGKQPGSEE